MGVAQEGMAQQDKAEAQRDAARKEAEADSARAGAKVAEKRRRLERPGRPCGALGTATR